MTRYFEWPEEIRHLSEEQVDELYQRYLNGEKTSDLITEFKLPETVRSILRVLPPLISADLKCRYCELPMWMRRPAKGGSVAQGSYKCVNCEHRESASGRKEWQMLCRCDECLRIYQEQVAAQAERDRLEMEARYAKNCASRTAGQPGVCPEAGLAGAPGRWQPCRR